MQWLTKSLTQEIRKVFEPRYKRKLNDEEVITIADNLTEIMECFLKLKLREYENQQVKS